MTSKARSMWERYRTEITAPKKRRRVLIRARQLARLDGKRAVTASALSQARREANQR